MSTTKWTPGPWFLGTNHAAADAAAVGFPAAIQADDPGRDPWNVAGVVHHAGPFDQLQDRTMANAHLIAAAPELYEALVKSNELLSRVYDALSYDAALDFQTQTNDAVLAKARGEATS